MKTKNLKTKKVQKDDKTESLFDNIDSLYSKIGECEEHIQDSLTNMLNFMVYMDKKVKNSKEENK